MAAEAQALFLINGKVGHPSTLRHRLPYQMLAILFRSYSFIVQKTLSYLDFQSFYSERHLINIFLGKTVNSTCRTSQECYGKLVCIKGNCQCSEQLYWDGTNCIMSKLDKHFKTITACIYSFFQETQGYRNIFYYTDNRNILRYSNEIKVYFTA